MASQPRTITPAKLYGEAGLIYIRHHATIESKPNGQKKVGGARPAFSKIQKQIPYQPGSGDYYSLLMGREFQPGRWVVLLDFDNKVEGDTRSGLELVQKLNMDQYNAPCQTTPSGGFHYLFYADAQQKDHIGSPSKIMHEGVKYNMDVKFRNSLCNCAPTKIEGYGSYRWVKTSRLRDIPRLPEELFQMIRTRPRLEKPTQNPESPLGNLEKAPLEGVVGEHEISDLRALCACLSVGQLDDYSTWIRVGMILKACKAPLSLWEQVSMRSKKYQNGDCA